MLIFSQHIFVIFLNETIRTITITPVIFKNSDITAVFKKGLKESKENYRLSSILPFISKTFQKIISKQITNFMDPLLSKYQFGMVAKRF